MPRWNKPLRSRSGAVSSVAAHIAMGGARALTSHARCLYDERYCTKGYRFPSLVFAFDAVLMLVLAATAAIAVSVALRPVLPPTIMMSFQAPDIVAAQDFPVAVTLTADPDSAHDNVRLTWHIPDGMELLRAEPPIQRDGTVYIGTIRPGESVRSHAVVRVFHTVGSESTIGFTLRTVEGGAAKEYAASVSRTVRASLLTSEVPEAFRVDAVAPSNVIIPIRVTNESAHALPYVEVRPDETSDIPFDRIVMGDLAPGETRYAMIHLGLLRERPELRWGVYSASRELTGGVWSAGRVQAGEFPVVREPLIMRPGVPLSFRVNGLVSGDRILVMNPFFPEPVGVFSPSPDDPVMTLPGADVRPDPHHEWFIEPLRILPDGSRYLGPATKGVFASGLPFDVRVRYRSVSGDQLGIGPHPPVPGIETRYWVFFTVGPVDDAVRDVRVRTELPGGVSLTGNVSSPDGGSWSVADGGIRWDIPLLGSESGPTTALFGYEISVTPDEFDHGGVIDLVSASVAQATDIHQGIVLRAEESAKTSENVDE